MAHPTTNRSIDGTRDPQALIHKPLALAYLPEVLPTYQIHSIANLDPGLKILERQTAQLAGILASINPVIRRLALQPAPCPTRLLASPLTTLTLAIAAIFFTAVSKGSPPLNHLLVDPQYGFIIVMVGYRNWSRARSTAWIAGNVENEVLEAIHYESMVMLRLTWPDGPRGEGCDGGVDVRA